MPGTGDYRIQHDQGPRGYGPDEPQRSRAFLVWILVAAAVVALGVFGYFLRRPAPPVPETQSVTQPVPETTQEVPQAKTPELPSLDGSDALVRAAVRGLSSRPELVTWLATDDLVRTFVAFVDNVARGASPRSLLGEFAPSQPFRAAGGGTRFTTDPRSFARYNGLADAFTSLNTAGVARALDELAPLCESAYRELGVEGTFRGSLERAMGRLLATPDIAADVPLTWNLVTYQYADDQLESLTAAEKHFLRMGPRNMKAVKDKIGQLATALNLTPRAPSQ